MDPETTKTEETKMPDEKPVSLDAIRELLASEREASRTEFAAELDKLRTPDRSTVAELGIGTTQHPKGEESTIRTDRSVADIAGGVSVSRVQPIDYFYRQMPEDVQMWRTPESDHHCAEWIRGQFLKDFSRMKESEAKVEDWVARSYGRADTLEGAAGASGALSAGTAGPYIPRPLEQLVLIARDKVGKMRRFANHLNMTKQTHTIPTSTAMTFAMTAEGTTPAGGEGTSGSVQLSAQEGVVKAVVGLNVLDDEAVNLVGAYTTLAGSAIGAGEDLQFWSSGNGTPPNISSKVDGTAFTETTSGALGFVDVVGMYYAVPQIYRDNAAWFGAPNVLQMLSLVIDGNSSRQFYSGLGDSAGAITDDRMAVGTLLRKPVYEVQAADGVLMFGDMRAAYTVGTRMGIQATSSEHILFDQRKVMWLWTTRFDGNDVDAIALQRCAGITSATNAAA